MVEQNRTLETAASNRGRVAAAGSSAGHGARPMATSHTATPSHVTQADLAAMGFTAKQIAQLEALARRYPLIEFLDAEAEWQHLVFLKWCHATQRLPD